MTGTPAPEDLTVTVRGDIEVVVPNNVWLLTPYVLVEQEDWFEDEIAFVRRYLRPGMRVLDLGANYGLYALTAAGAVGPEGSVWAFEPAAQAAGYLSRSIAANGFDHLHLVRAGVSAVDSRGFIHGGDTTETNVVVHGAEPGNDYEPIELLALDSCTQKFGWDDFDFMKMDVEGEELNVLEGGKAFFSGFSPLIMFEFRREETFNLPLLEKFEALGYSIFRLIPGLGILAPYSGDDLDGMCLNLFCARPERIAGLQARSLAAGASAGPPGPAEETAWAEYLQRFPYAVHAMQAWSSGSKGGRPEQADRYRAVLNDYAFAQDESVDVTHRFAYLSRAYEEISALVREAPSLPRLATFVRIAGDMGMRTLTVGPLEHIAKHLRTGRRPSFNEPFLCVSPVFDGIDPGDRMDRWFRAAVLYQWQKAKAFSSYFDEDPDGFALLQEIREVGFQQPEMERRRQLWMHCYGQSEETVPSILTSHGRYNLNPGIWRERRLMTRAALAGRTG